MERGKHVRNVAAMGFVQLVCTNTLAVQNLNENTLRSRMYALQDVVGGLCREKYKVSLSELTLCKDAMSGNLAFYAVLGNVDTSEWKEGADLAKQVSSLLAREVNRHIKPTARVEINSGDFSVNILTPLV